MPKFRKKPVIIDAIQTNFTGKTLPEIIREYGLTLHRSDTRHLCPSIETLEGPMCVSDGDWIITGIRGERYPCKPDIFEDTYEAFNEDELHFAYTVST